MRHLSCLATLTFVTFLSLNARAEDPTRICESKLFLLTGDDVQINENYKTAQNLSTTESPRRV